MTSTLGITGTASLDELKATPGYPSDDALSRRPLAVIECLQEIPCNPCEDACPKGAITVGEPITRLPVFDANKCDGCGLCITTCPGLAIFLVDNTYSETEAEVSFPWEYLPLPARGETVEAVNRLGEVVCKGKVHRVRNSPKQDRTAVVSLVVPKECSAQVRGMKLVRRAEGE
jgi:Fe-S-cluster-containing hydrogenase component 2